MSHEAIFKLRHMCNLHIKETEISQKRSKGIKHWKITYCVILSVFLNKTNLILGYSSPLRSSYGPPKIAQSTLFHVIWRGIGISFQSAIIASRLTLIDYDNATAQSYCASLKNAICLSVRHNVIVGHSSYYHMVIPCVFDVKVFTCMLPCVFFYACNYKWSQYWYVRSEFINAFLFGGKSTNFENILIINKLL